MAGFGSFGGASGASGGFGGFGQQKTSGFGQNTGISAGQPGAFGFGGGAAQNASTGVGVTSGFGTGATGASNTGFGGFGAAKPAATGFGAAPATSGFGTGAAPAASGFGAAPKTGGLGGFGTGAPAASGFGAAPATGAFGSTAPAATGAFGSTAPAASTGFGAPPAAAAAVGSSGLEVPPASADLFGGKAESVMPLQPHPDSASGLVAELSSVKAREAFTSIVWSSDGTIVAAGSLDGNVYLVSLANPGAAPTVVAFGAPVMAVSFANNNAQMVFAGLANGRVMVAPTTGGGVASPVPVGEHGPAVEGDALGVTGGGYKGVVGLVFDSSLPALISLGVDGKLKVWAVQPNAQPTLAKEVALGTRPTAMDVSSGFAVASLANRQVAVVQLSSGQRQDLMSPLRCPAVSVRVFAHARACLLGSTEGRVAVLPFNGEADKALSCGWKAHRRDTPTELIGSANSVDICNGDAVVASGGGDGGLVFMHVGLKKRPAAPALLPGDAITSIKFSPDGSKLAFASGLDSSNPHTWSSQRTARLFILNVTDKFKTPEAAPPAATTTAAAAPAFGLGATAAAAPAAAATGGFGGLGAALPPAPAFSGFGIAAPGAAPAAAGGFGASAAATGAPASAFGAPANATNSLGFGTGAFGAAGAKPAGFGGFGGFGK